MAKLAKTKVGFEHPAKGPHHCSQCSHYLGDGACELVAGRIKPGDWCERFKDKEASKAEKHAAHIILILGGPKK